MASAEFESYGGERIEPIRRSVTVRCAPDRAYRVFTAEMSSWWPLATHSRAAGGPRPDVKALGVVVEERAGGVILERLSDGSSLPWGRVLAWDPPRRLVMAWNPDGLDHEPTEVEITFTAIEGGTRVDLVHRGWERLGSRAAEARKGYGEGWGVVLGKHYAEAADRGAA